MPWTLCLVDLHIYCVIVVPVSCVYNYYVYKVIVILYHEMAKWAQAGSTENAIVSNSLRVKHYHNAKFKV